MKFKSIALLTACITCSAVAQQYTPPSYNTLPTYNYDYSTGNSYSTSESFDGSTRVNGYNTGTGSMWNTTIEQDGDMRGVDSKGNYWNYDSSTGNYMSTSGRICTGKGQSRICTGGN